MTHTSIQPAGCTPTDPAASSSDTEKMQERTSHTRTNLEAIES